MTERLGSAAGWRTAAVVAPAAAAALALATGWAMQHPPVSAASSTPAPAAPARSAEEAPFGADHGDLTLHQRAFAEQARVMQLTTMLRKVQARTKAVRSTPVGAGSGGGATTYVSASGGGSVSVAAPPVPVARAAAPAPATHTSTGASGAKK